MAYLLPGIVEESDKRAALKKRRNVRRIIMFRRVMAFAFRYSRKRGKKKPTSSRAAARPASPKRPFKKSDAAWLTGIITLAAGITYTLWRGSRSVSLAFPGWAGPAFLWLLAVAALIGLVIFLAKMKWYPKGAALKKVPWGKIVGWTLKTAVIAGIAAYVLFFLPTQVRVWQMKQTGEMPTTILVTDAWTDFIAIPQNKMVIEDPRINAAYQVRYPNGHIYTTPRAPEPDLRTGCERYQAKWHDEPTGKFQLRLVDKDVKSTIFDLTIATYRRGGPCGEIPTEAATPTVLAPKPSVPLFRPLVPKKEPKEEPRPKLARPSTPWKSASYRS